MHDRPFPTLSQTALLVVAAIGLTYGSFIYQRPGQWLNLDGGVCQQGQQSQCYIPTRNAGFPLAYIVNRVTFTIFSGPGEDFQFSLGSFVLNVLFYSAILWGGFLVLRNSLLHNRD